MKIIKSVHLKLEPVSKVKPHMMYVRTGSVGTRGLKKCLLLYRSVFNRLILLHAYRFQGAKETCRQM